MMGSNCFRAPCSLLVCLLTLCLGAPAMAYDVEEWAVADETAEAPGSVTITQGVPPFLGLLFVGTSTNVNDPTSTANDIFTVDPVLNTSTSVLTATQIWGATADPANLRVLFTRASGLTPPAGQLGGGDELMEVPYAGGAPTAIGRITTAAGGFRIDGLAMSGGVLYGVNAGAGAENGLYSIDLTTLVATEIALFLDSISGLDADPNTGVIYGTNDTTGQLVTISTGGVIANLEPYPAGLTDVDGLAVGNGFVYLVTDEAGIFGVYDIAADAYVTPLTSPFTVADTFSGAALAIALDLFCDGFETGDTSEWSSTVP